MVNLSVDQRNTMLTPQPNLPIPPTGLLLRALLFVYSLQGRSQDYIKGVLNSAGPLLVQIQTHYLAKHLAIRDDAHHPVNDYSHYIVKIQSLVSYMCIVAY